MPHTTASAKSRPSSFWTTLPGILTAVATLIGAIAGLIAVFNRPSPLPAQPQPVVKTGSEDSTSTRLAPGLSNAPASVPKAEVDDTTPPVPANWIQIGQETFTQTSADWMSGMVGEPGEILSRSDVRPVDGVYRLDATIHSDKGWSGYVYAGYPPAANFAAAMDIRFTDFTPSTTPAGGLLFGYSDSGYYQLIIAPTHEFLVAKDDRKANTKTTLINWTHFATKFDPAQWNRLAVRVDNGLIRCYLNSEFLGEHRDDSFPGGKVGVIVDLYTTGSAVYDFDNFEYRRKP